MKHADLIDRLKAGHGVDRELDAEIYCAFNAGSKLALIDGKSLGFVNTAEMQLCKAGHYTESLDACIGLMREVLPDYYCSFGFGGKKKPSVILVPPGARIFMEASKGGHEDDLCRALLIAILQAVGEEK